MKRMAVFAWAIAVAVPAAAEEPAFPARPAAGGEFFHSSDSDGAEVVRAAIDFDLRNQGEDRYLGVGVEQAWYNPDGTAWRSRERVFLRAADTAGKWSWRARVGTDGKTIIGTLSMNDEGRFRKEVVVERDIVETRQGLDRGIYSTFVGAAVDLPADDRNIVTALVGVQSFTGDNIRLHLRANYIHLVKPAWGLSVQLRGRYFRSSAPGEFDYYSPRWYAEAVPVVQIRRFTRGWEWVGAGGLGIQRDSGSGWLQSRYLHARFRSPSGSNGWSVHGSFTYTSTPSVTAAANAGYSYVQSSLGIARRF